MNRIITSHLKSFSDKFELSKLKEEKRFEMFANYCIISQSSSSDFDPKSFTSDIDDAGIDGIAFFLDEELVSTKEEVELILSRKKSTFECNIVLIQSTTADSFSKQKISNFMLSVKDFLSSKPKLTQGEFIKSSHDLFSLIIKNAVKLKNGKPSISLYYVTTGSYNPLDPNITGTFATGKTIVSETKLFSTIEVLPVDCDAILSLWNECIRGTEVLIPVISQMPFPKMKDVKQAWIATAKAKDFVDQVLKNERGELRHWAFEENVRGFLGLDEPVNLDIQNTIQSPISAEHFAILNNGITIVATKITSLGTEIKLSSFQIVNGCQTSNVLFRNYSYLNDSVVVTLKIIEAESVDIQSEIVRATNKQTKVDENQFIGLLPIVKRIESYFNGITDIEKHLYFERRLRQYGDQAIPQSRIFNVRDVSRAVSSVFFEKPDLASRYPNQMFTELRDQLYNKDNKEIIYYTAALLLYKCSMLISNDRIPTNSNKYKWHIILGVSQSILKSDFSKLNSRKIEQECETIIKVISGNDLGIKHYKFVSEYIHTENPTRDRLTSAAFIKSIKEKARANNQ